MSKHDAHNHYLNQIMRTILFAALVLRFLIPQGFMIDNSSKSNNNIAIIICHEQNIGVADLVNDGEFEKLLKSNNQKNKNQQKDGDSCGFVGFNAGINQVQSELFSFNAKFAIIHSNIDFTNINVGRGLAAPPPPSTGPPLKA
jgi:hypothetical protein